MEFELSEIPRQKKRMKMDPPPGPLLYIRPTDRAPAWNAGKKSIVWAMGSSRGRRKRDMNRETSCRKHPVLPKIFGRHQAKGDQRGPARQHGRETLPVRWSAQLAAP